MNTISGMFAAIDGSCGCVYGIGETIEAAIADARHYDADVGSSQVVPCTEAAAEYVRNYGGSPSRELSVSSVRGVCLISEEYADNCESIASLASVLHDCSGEHCAACNNCD